MAEPIPPTVIRRLDGDLLIRRAEAADIDAVVALNVEVFGPQDAGGVRAWLSGPVDVEWLIAVAGPGADRPGQGTLAAACARIPIVYDLDGTALPGSQIENVTTDARFRRRGLVRSLFEVHHERAAAAGELLQVIGGIPYFYRKLGYGYGFDAPPTISVGARTTPPPDDDRVTIRDARPEDAAWLLVAEDTRRREGLTVRRTRATFDTWITRAAPAEDTGWEAMLVAEVDGAPVGWLRTFGWAEEAQLFVLPGEAPDLEVADRLLTRAIGLGRDLADDMGRPVEVLASDRPGTAWSRAVQAAGYRRPEPSGYYARTADPVALLEALRPVLSRRLAASGLGRDHGELVISLYDRGIRLVWADGVVQRVESAPAEPDPFDKGGVGVAPDWFPALALGRWGASGLAARTDDTLLGDHAALMDVLFPARPNDVVIDL